MIYAVWFAECENCKATVEGGTKDELMENLHKEGWTITRWDLRYRHLCPDHSIFKHERKSDG